MAQASGGLGEIIEQLLDLRGRQRHLSVPSGCRELKMSWGFTFKSILIMTLVLWSR